MSTATTARPERDPVKDARLNLILQLLLFMPFLAIFGATVVNVVVASVFLLIAVVRLLNPTEAMRKFELYMAIAMTVVWVVLQVI